MSVFYIILNIRNELRRYASMPVKRAVTLCCDKPADFMRSHYIGFRRMKTPIYIMKSVIRRDISGIPSVGFVFPDVYRRQQRITRFTILYYHILIILSRGICKALHIVYNKQSDEKIIPPRKSREFRF